MVNSSKYILKRDSRYTCVAVILWHFDLPRNCVKLNCVRASDGSAFMECSVLLSLSMCFCWWDCFVWSVFCWFFFFYMLFLLGGLFKRTFHVEKNAERDKLAVTMGKKTGGRFKDDWDWLKMKGGNEQKRPTWIISVDVSMAVSWLINCGYYNYLLIGMIFQVPRKGERHVSRYSLYDVRNISQFWRKNVNR